MLASQLVAVAVAVAIFATSIIVTMARWTSAHIAGVSPGAGGSNDSISHPNGHGKSILIDDPWPSWCLHRAPGRPFTVEEAHREMQRHLACTMEVCERKSAAFATLVVNGRVKPDSSRQTG